MGPARAVGGIPLQPPAIRPRSQWGAGLPPTGPMAAELPGDVRFLLVHHSASPNHYRVNEVPRYIRSFYALHTGSRGWPDVAYNFLVDRFGGIWEGRSGSIQQPVMGDATGGSQGFAVLCCFIGDHRDVAPTPEAQRSMVGLLGWLADTYGIATAPGSTTTFVSRGSSRWPAGTQVSTPTIAGHRDMSATVCPGDAAYGLVKGVFPLAVTAWRAGQNMA
jgi:N-acetylmuramoyl-L-alanine amidase-like protein